MTDTSDDLGATPANAALDAIVKELKRQAGAYEYIDLSDLRYACLDGRFDLVALSEAVLDALAP